MMYYTLEQTIIIILEHNYSNIKTIILVKIREAVKMNGNNCKDCKNRYIGCHSTCEVYKKFKENIENRNIKIQKYKELYKPKLY